MIIGPPPKFHGTRDNLSEPRLNVWLRSRGYQEDWSASRLLVREPVGVTTSVSGAIPNARSTLFRHRHSRPMLRRVPVAVLAFRTAWVSAWAAP